MGPERAAVVPDKFLHRQPARALHEAALDLPDIERGVQRPAAIVEDIGPRMRFSPVSVSITTSEQATP
jgi:hypothetical protein